MQHYIPESYHLYERDTLSAKFVSISHQVSAALLPGVSAGYFWRALLSESGMITAQMGMHNKLIQ
jgi:hypothetical protein